MLTFDSQVIRQIAVIRCKGRIAYGADLDALQAEIDRLTKIEGSEIFIIKQVLLQLAEADYIDSSGLGALVRLHGVLRAAGGGLKLCEMSTLVRHTIKITNLGILFPTYESEADAIEAFRHFTDPQSKTLDPSKTCILCVDTSSDLLAGLNALLTHAGYEVFTSRFAGEATRLAKVLGPRVAICGPGLMAQPNGPAVMETLQRINGLKTLQLPPDFHITEAGQAAQNLLNQLGALVAS